MTAVKRYLPALAGLGVFALASASVAGMAWADDNGPGDPTPVVVDAPTVTVQTYSASDFTADAAKLPAGMKDAINRDLGISAAEYLAQAEAAKNASDVQNALEAQGVDVLQAELTDDGVTIAVKDAADVPAVEATGAKAQVGVPEGPALKYEPKPAVPLADQVGGQGNAMNMGGGSYSLCTTGFNGYNASGANINFTAGHCADTPDLLLQSPDRPRNTNQELGLGAPNAYLDGLTTTVLGRYNLVDAHWEDDVNDGSVMGYLGQTGLPQISNWGGTHTNPSSAGSVDIYGSIGAVVGAAVCKSGATSGWTCGNVTAAEELVTVGLDGGGETDVVSIGTDMCVLGGDSGGPDVVGNYALGVNSNGNFTAARDLLLADYDPMISTACDREVQSRQFAREYVAAHPGEDEGDVYAYVLSHFSDYFGSGLFAVNSGSASAKTLYGDDFQLAVVVSTPTVDMPAYVATSGSTISGNLPNATADHAVTVAIDGAAPPTTVTVDSAGNWSLPLTGLTAGPHTYTVTGVYGAGQYSKSTPATGDFEAVNVAPLVITSPADGTVLGDARTPIVGTGHVGAAVSLSINGKDFGSVAVGDAGTFSLTPNADLPYGRFNVTVTHAIPSPAITTSATIANVGRTPPAPTVTSAATLKPGGTVAGNGTAGAAVKVNLAGPKAITGTATVAADGTWTWALPSDTPTGTYTMGVTQTIADLTSAATNSVLTVSATGSSGGLPNTGFGSEPFMIGLMAIALGGLAVAGVGLARRRHATR